MKKITRYAIRKRLRGRRTYKQALNSSKFKPVYFPRNNLIVMNTTRCNGRCSYCSNLIFPDAINQFQYKEKDAVLFANALNRFYGHWHYYISGGECAMMPDFHILVQNIKYANLNIMTNLSEPSVEQLLKIGKTSNNIMLDITYHFHTMEFREFVKRYNTLSMFESNVHLVKTDGVDAEDTIAFLNRYGINARWTNEFTDYGIFERKPKKVLCTATNTQIMPDGTIHPCRSRALRKCKEVGSIFDEEISYNFNQQIQCDFYGWCGPCDIDREVIYDR